MWALDVKDCKVEKVEKERKIPADQKGDLRDWVPRTQKLQKSVLFSQKNGGNQIWKIQLNAKIETLAGSTID